MFNATKLVVAGAIVAVVGGYLINTSAPRTELNPAQAVGSPSPATSASPSPASSEPPPSPSSSEAPSSGLLTEEVEPGVVRIISDGAGHDLKKGHPRNPYDTDGISIGGDGTVWVNSTYHGADNESHPQAGPLVWALGRPGVLGVRDGVPQSSFNNILATADGSALMFGGGGLVEFDGSRFVHAGSTSYPLAAGTLSVVSTPDETIYLINAGGHWTSLDAWTKLVDIDGSFCMATFSGVQCGGERFGSGKTYLAGQLINQIALAPDGSLWAVTGSDRGGGLYRITFE